jgi:hypothetical protein
LTLWDFGTDTVHYWRHRGPQMDVLGPQLAALAAAAVGGDGVPLYQSAIAARVIAAAESMTAQMTDAPPLPGEDYNDRLQWLLKCRAYCELNDTVIELFKQGNDCEVKPSAFERRYEAWYRSEMVRGVERKVPITSDWGKERSRIHVEGARMQPGANFPLFRDAGLLWKNTYRRPQHAGTGTVAPFMAFMERFLPDKREREWQLDWMAHKWLHPEVPGTAVLFVADDDDDEVRGGKFGTGRGRMFKIAHRLYGRQYARAQAFSILEGSSGQSAFNAWMHGNLLVTVDETRTSATAHRRGEKKSVYEVMKDIVDPDAKDHTFNVKYGRAFYGVSYCSYWLASNHADAMAIPANDRRFTILRNGRVMTPEEAREIMAWMEDEGNIAALAAMLEARDLSGFNMYQPLETAAKQTMIELGRSKVEETLIELMEDDARGLVFTRQQLEHAVEDIVRPWERRRGGADRRRDAGQWQGEFAAAWGDYCVGLKTEGGTHWKVRVGGLQVKLYCFRKRRPAAIQLHEGRRRVEAAKWGPIDTLKEQLSVLSTQHGTQQKDD